MLRNCDCCPTYLVTSVTDNGGANYILNFRTVPTLTNGGVLKFRLADSITTVAVAGVPLFANVTVNGALVSVPLTDCIGNNVRTGDDLRTRTVYKAVFGSDPNHLQIINFKRCKCLEA